MTAKPAAVSSSSVSSLSDVYMKPEEVCAITGHTTRGLRYMASKGRGPARIRIGKFTIYRKSSVEQWLARHESQPEQEPKPYDRKRKKATR